MAVKPPNGSTWTLPTGTTATPRPRITTGRCSSREGTACNSSTPVTGGPRTSPDSTPAANSSSCESRKAGKARTAKHTSGVAAELRDLSWTRSSTTHSTPVRPGCSSTRSPRSRPGAGRRLVFVDSVGAPVERRRRAARHPLCDGCGESSHHPHRSTPSARPSCGCQRLQRQLPLRLHTHAVQRRAHSGFTTQHAHRLPADDRRRALPLLSTSRHEPGFRGMGRAILVRPQRQLREGHHPDRHDPVSRPGVPVYSPTAGDERPAHRRCGHRARRHHPRSLGR